MQSKRCSKCGETKLVSGFCRDRKGSGGLSSQCKECCRDRSRAYHEAHRDEINARKRSYYEAYLEWVRTYDPDYYEAYRDEINASYRAYYEENRDELRVINRKRKAKTRSAAREVATRNGEPWTPAEDRVVLTSDGTLLEIAITLGRTMPSVMHRRKRLRSKAVTA